MIWNIKTSQLKLEHTLVQHNLQQLQLDIDVSCFYARLIAGGRSRCRCDWEGMESSVAPQGEDCHSRPSIHPSVQRVLGLSERVQSFLPTVTSTSSFGRIPKLSLAKWQLSSLLHVLRLRLLNGHLSPGRQNAWTNRLLWRWRSRSSTLSSSWMSELLTPLSLSPAPQQRKLIWAACTCV